MHASNCSHKLGSGWIPGSSRSRTGSISRSANRKRKVITRPAAFGQGGHVGEGDWDGVRGGDTDLGDTIYCAGDWIVVFARDVHLGWGNVIIVTARLSRGHGEICRLALRPSSGIRCASARRPARGPGPADRDNGQLLCTGNTTRTCISRFAKIIEIGMSRSKFRRISVTTMTPTPVRVRTRHLTGWQLEPNLGGDEHVHPRLGVSFRYESKFRGAETEHG